MIHALATAMEKYIRLFETVRHLSAEQWLHRAVVRGQRVYRNIRPEASYRSISNRALKLPEPNLDSDRLLRVAQHVLELQRAVHSPSAVDFDTATFTLLNRTVSFGSLDQVEWRRDLQENNNPLWRMNLAYFGWAVPLLSRGDRFILEKIGGMLASLDRQNSFSTAGVFRDVWNAYTASHRCVNLLAGLALYQESGGTPDAAISRRIINHVKFCAAFVASSLERELQYNHLLKNYVALSVYSAGCREIPRLFGAIRKAIMASVLSQILSDGGQSERAPMYHALSVLDVRILLDSGILDATRAKTLEALRKRMEAALLVMTHPDGDVALFNDSWLGEAPPTSRLLPGARLPECRTLPETGYTRLAGNGDAVIFDHGACGPDDNPGHAHADFLAIEASVGGTRFIVDLGVPTYTMGDMRNLSRSAKLHNGPHLVGAEPIDFWASFRVGRRGYAWSLALDGLEFDGALIAAGRQNGYAPWGIDVRRCVLLWPGSALAVFDLWKGEFQMEPQTRWIVAGIRKKSSPEMIYSLGNTTIAVSAALGDQTEANPSRHWPRFGLSRDVHTFCVLPERTVGMARSVTLFRWSQNFKFPDHAIAATFDKLSDC